MEGVTSAIVLASTTKIIENILDDLYESLKGKAAISIKRRSVTKKLPELVNRIQSVRFVKTLWQLDKPVDVESFYCASKVLIPGSRGTKKRKTIDTAAHLGALSNVVIRGIAGQGKSILLRHMCIREFEAGRRLPVFIELRRIQKGESLLDHISRYLDILGIPVDLDLFKVLSRSGKLVFFLDAFDEIQQTQESSVLNQLEHLVASSPNSQFIVTSRPHSSIEVSPLFTVVTLDDLSETECCRIIRKLSDTPKSATALINAIKAHKGNIAGLLCTPLLVTLLIISYKSFQKLPERLSEFYESIFTILLQRHDGTKPGFIRPRRCSINDNQYRSIFNAFCFESKKFTGYSMTYEQVYGLVEKAMHDATKVTEDPDKYLKDIAKVTCLLLEEGNEYRFMHRSVQEYYAASFVRSRPETIAKGFYDACMKPYPNWSNWEQELAFLTDIDTYRYAKYYLIPLCHRWLKIDDDQYLLNGLPPMTQSRARDLIGHFLIGFHESDPPSTRPDMFHFAFLQQLLPDDSPANLCLHLDYRELIEHFTKRPIQLDSEIWERHYSHVFKDKSLLGSRTLAFQQILDEGILVDDFISIAQQIEHKIYDLWRSYYDYVHDEDSYDIIAGVSVT